LPEIVWMCAIASCATCFGVGRSFALTVSSFRAIDFMQLSGYKKRLPNDLIGHMRTVQIAGLKIRRYIDTSGVGDSPHPVEF